MPIQPTTPKGFNDTEPAEALELERIQSVLQDSFKRYGFLPIDTPIVEYRTVLVGAESGIAGDNQIFTVGNIDYSRAEQVTDSTGKEGYLVEPELGLRFDLTVPLSRFVAKRAQELSFPFKRYHIAKVFRGERPQSGRYREFIQCDVDTISNHELTPYEDAEALACAHDAFTKLGITDAYFKVNNRRVVQELLFSTVGSAVDVAGVLRVLDKRAKQDDAKTIADLAGEQGISGGSAKQLLATLDEGYQPGISAAFDAALQELTEYVDTAHALGVPREKLVIDPSLARGLGYYTGNVVETFITGQEQFGSVCSGGRYDNLTENYGLKGYPGTGLSIGLSRLQAALREQGDAAATPRTLDVYLGVLDGTYREAALKMLTEWRQAGLAVVCNITEHQVKKIMRSADRSACRYVVLLGETEMSTGICQLKDLTSGESQEVVIKDLANALRTV